MGKSEVEVEGTIGALRKTLRSFVGMHIFEHANKLTTHAPFGGTQINSQPAIHGQREAAGSAGLSRS
eukprot:3355995-Pleurochrysis_carterae.AAC.1